MNTIDSSSYKIVLRVHRAPFEIDDEHYSAHIDIKI
jgi:hypothetical protein